MRRVLDRIDRPVVLAGHSFARTIISEVGSAPNVAGLVYVAGRAPDAGEDYRVRVKRFPAPPASEGVVFDGDVGRLTEDAFLRDFARDIPEPRAKALFAVQQTFHKALTATKTTAAWKTKPGYDAVSTQDRTIDPDQQRFMARRMGATTI